MGYILKDMKNYKTWSKYLDCSPGAVGKFSGWALLVYPPDTRTALNSTALLQMNMWQRLYYFTLFWLGNQEYIVRKVDEMIEISPTHRAYYELVMGQKDALAAQIRTTVDEIVRQIADLELLKHDYRRYKEILDYFEKNMEHNLKAMFIDQVDFYSGEGAPGRLSMSFMQQRNIFPTIIQDFLDMKSLEDLEKNPRLRELPRVEKDVLRVKFNAYQEWKEMFRREVETRVKELERLIKTKEAVINEMREGLKPKVARFKMIKHGFSKETERKSAATLFHRPGAEATSLTKITVWAWKEFFVPEFYKSGEVRAFRPVDPYDEFTRKNLIFNEKIGLKAQYKWITKEWVEKCVDDIKSDLLITRKRHESEPPPSPYYSFFILEFERYTLRSATGSELEDITIYIDHFLMSQNVLLVKLLELKARQEEFEEDINKIIGQPRYEKDEKEEKKEEKKAEEGEKKEEKKKIDVGKMMSEAMKKAWDSLGIKFKLMRRGPYERDFERLKRFYLSPVGKYYYRPLVDRIKSQMIR